MVYAFFLQPSFVKNFSACCIRSTGHVFSINLYHALKIRLRGPSTLTWELRTGESKTTLEDKKKIGNVTYYISSESQRDAESEKSN